MPTVLGQCVHAEDHLPRTVFVVHGGVCVHLVGQICLVRHKAVYKRNEPVPVEHQPEVVPVVLDSTGKVFFRGRFRRGKAHGLHCGDRRQVLHGCMGDFHKGSSFKLF